jgi:hypothetical protein
MRLPSGRQAENDGLAWLRRAAAARDRLRLAHAQRCSDSRPSGGPMAGAFVTRYDASS